MDTFAPYAKAIASLVGSITTALLGLYATDTYAGQVLTIVGVIATTVATFQIPNAPVRNPGEDG